MGSGHQQSPSLFRRAWAFAYRHALKRRLPHGVVTPRYLVPGASRNIRIHRRLWLHGLPRVPFPLYVLMEIFLWLRWVLFSGWLGTLRSVKRWGPAIRDREGIGTFTQFQRVLRTALFLCVLPAEVYAFRLYRADGRSKVWDYVFTQELPAFHRWRDARQGKTGGSVRLLGDKYRSSRILSQQGVPVVPVIEVVPRGAVFDPSVALKDHSKLFCKPRNGTAGRGGFVLERREGNPAPIIYETKAGARTEPSTRARLLAASAQDDYLIQPFMANHPDLAGLSETDDAVTVRIITEVQDAATIGCYCAMLEIPRPGKDPTSGKAREAGTRFHVILPLEPTTGKILRLDADALPHPVLTFYNDVYSKAENRTVPFWDELEGSALAAHASFRDVYAIAWDYVVTPDGPFLLEGNSGWATRMPQVIHGGLLGPAK